MRAVLAAVTWASLAALAATGGWLWLEYVPVDAGAPTAALTAEQADVVEVRDLHRWATAALVVAAPVWLAAIAVSSATSRRLVAAGAVLVAVGGGVAAWTGSQLAWTGIETQDELARPTGERGLLRGEPVVAYVVDGEELTPEHLQNLAWGHVLGTVLVVVGLASAAGLARARRRRPDDDRMPAPRTGPTPPTRLTLPADVEAGPEVWDRPDGAAGRS